MEPINRRTLLKVTAAAAVAPHARLVYANATTDRRLIVVVLRGGMDGLAAVPPHGDPHYESARTGLTLPPPGETGGVLPLDATFALHPNLPNLATLYHEGALLPIHAVCVPYHGRSHFEAQNVLENGAAIPYLLKSGWLNRALAGLPHTTADVGIAIAQTMPVIMRGDTPVTSWYPSVLPQPDADTLERIASMYSADAKLAAALQRAHTAHAMATEGEGGARFAALLQAAGGFLARPHGPRVALIESSGWDTHANQRSDYGALNRNLAELDRGVAALRGALGDHWEQSAVLVMTEFGRTVAMNGTGGTDHGTGGAALLFGGAVAGGRVLADWPGLAPGDLLEGRDLKPTIDLRSVFKGLLAEHLGVSVAHIEAVVFPDSGTVQPIAGLIRPA
jgi:uncharacterized protein (DUF1501 family)